MVVWVDGSPVLSGRGNQNFWVVCSFSDDFRSSLTYSFAWSVLSSARTLRAAELSGCICLASCGDKMENSAIVAFILRVNGFGEVLVTRT